MSPTPAVAARLEIIMTSDRQCRITGPLEDKMLCYAMLGMAQELLSKHEPAKQVPILLARGALPGM